MAKPNYAFAKRQRDLAKQKKKEEKRQKKAAAAPGPEDEAQLDQAPGVGQEPVDKSAE